MMPSGKFDYFRQGDLISTQKFPTLMKDPSYKIPKPEIPTALDMSILEESVQETTEPGTEFTDYKGGSNEPATRLTIPN